MWDDKNNLNEFPQRKKIRLPHIRYNENGAYFITICTRDRTNLFWDVGAAIRRPPDCLSPHGLRAMKRIEDINVVYQGIITVDNHVVMPNHVHLLLIIHPEQADGRRIAAPTLSSVVNQYKGRVSKDVGFSCWQKSFHDHIVRDEREYEAIWEYIDSNPRKWEEDRYYIGIAD